MKLRVSATRPSQKALFGHSPSEFKTLLKRSGHRVPKNFFNACVSSRKGLLYRWRWWSDGGFSVDIVVKSEFDRWANSTDMVEKVESWIELRVVAKAGIPAWAR